MANVSCLSCPGTCASPWRPHQEAAALRPQVAPTPSGTQERYWQLAGQAIIGALPQALAQGLLEVPDRMHTTGEPFRNPALCSKPEGQPGTPLQAVYVDLTLRQFTERSQPAGIMIFAVEITDLVHLRAELTELRA